MLASKNIVVYNYRLVNKLPIGGVGGLDFGNRLLMYMSIYDMTQNELAEKTGLTAAAISRYISGEREPKIIAVVKIANALGVSTDELLGIEQACSDEVDEAIRVLARNASSISNKQKRGIIGALIE